jgi:hypothetical protein
MGDGLLQQSGVAERVLQDALERFKRTLAHGSGDRRPLQTTD